MDSDWLGRLVDRHAAAPELFARQWCDTPEDVVQEAFVKLASAHAAGQSGRLALSRGKKRFLNAAQAARRRRRHETRAASSSTGWFQPEPTRSASGSLDGDTAAEALRSLPLEQREVIVAHIWGGLSFQEIALVSACSASTAHRLYSSGLSTMRERLGVSCLKNRSVRN